MKMTDQTRKIVAAALIALAVIGGIAGFILLPDTLVVQLTLGGTAGNTMPKLLGLAIPVALAVFGAIKFYKDGGEAKPRNNGLIIALVGIVVFVLLFVFNL
ncbi:MAG TPA: hypothetical protein VN540_03570 [Clostridia bacterium]|nr:hypothetical protein [Clostridia bacterium]